MLCLWYLQCTNIWNKVQSNKLRTPAPLFAPSLTLLFSLSSLSQFWHNCLPQILFSSLSADWLAHLSEDKVPEWEKRRKTHAYTHIGSQVNTCNHMQTQACSLGCRRILNTNRYTDEYTRTETGLLRTHTYTHTKLTSKVLQRHAFPTYTW